MKTENIYTTKITTLNLRMYSTVENIVLENLHHNPIHAPTPTTGEMADPDLLQQPPSTDTDESGKNHSGPC